MIPSICSQLSSTALFTTTQRSLLRVSASCFSKASDSGILIKVVNDYTDYQQEVENRRRDRKETLNPSIVTNIKGDPEFGHVRHTT